MENESPFRGFSTADFQKLLHNGSSLVGSNESLAFEIPAVTYCLYIYFRFSESCKGFEVRGWIRPDLDQCWSLRINDINQLWICDYIASAPLNY